MAKDFGITVTQKGMGTFKIEGGIQLKGDVTPQGAKNEALQILCAVLLTPEKVTINNIPDIIDVNKLITLLGNLGVKIQKNGPGSITFQADEVNVGYLETEAFKKEGGSLRGSIMIVGPLLARFGKGYIPKPGGDKIGRRRLDTHFEGFINLGATFRYEREDHFYGVETKGRLKGAYMLLDEASVTGTANIVMAAVLAEGTTTIYNAACEPYLQQLCKMLNSMGANIKGVGSNLLIIDGVEQLGGCEHRILPDMIEIGSWIGLAAMTRSEITIKNVSWENLGVIPSVFRKLGITLEQKGDDIYIPAHTDGYAVKTDIDGSILTIADAPWPGFTPDLLSIVLVVATQANGDVLIHQKMFESRLFFVDKLIDMGAKIMLCDPHRAVVMGHDFKSQLKATTMSSPDIRAGISLLIAALSAKGTSTIQNIEQIDRGYERIDERLRALGANIVRV
jgi:UDP-N-acetylglucosamine 1-carboxyvinyltransferase